MHTVSDARKRTSENEGLKPEPTSDYVRDLCRRKLLLEQEVEQLREVNETLREVNETLRKVIKRLDAQRSPFPPLAVATDEKGDLYCSTSSEPQDWPLDEHGRFRA